MKATQGVAYSNTHIAAEWGANGRLSDNTEHIRSSKKGFFMKPKSDTTRANEAAEKRYVRRSNICDECHMTRAVGTGTCGC